jgi:N,N-dimethylformamidase
MYLGGNGFYWVTSLFADRPHVLEVRRGHVGTGVWRSDPGEVHHASTGELGGLWRFRGRPPQRMAGIGFTAQGFDESLPYRRADGSRDPRAAWIFEGVDDGDGFGAHGSVLGGAGGFELDRADPELGTPPHALVLATARGFSDVYQAVSEEVLTSDSQQGGTVSPLVRSDLVYFEGPNGGAVFSTGSIAWCGALQADDDVSRITENVLRRFAS